VYDLEVIGDTTFYMCGLSNDKAFLMRRTKPVLAQTFVVSVKNSITEDSKIELDSFFEEENQIRFYEIFDFHGRQIAQGSDLKFLNTQAIPKGVFLLKATKENNHVAFRKYVNW
jgi:hypothetical protein